MSATSYLSIIFKHMKPSTDNVVRYSMAKTFVFCHWLTLEPAVVTGLIRYHTAIPYASCYVSIGGADLEGNNTIGYVCSRLHRSFALMDTCFGYLCLWVLRQDDKV